MAFSKQQNTSGQLVQLSSANIGFALDLYQTLQDERRGTNLFFSPLSISTALAMTQLGARGDTATQIADVFRFNQIDQDQLHGTFKELNNLLYQSDSGYFLDIWTYYAGAAVIHDPKVPGKGTIWIGNIAWLGVMQWPERRGTVQTHQQDDKTPRSLLLR